MTKCDKTEMNHHSASIDGMKKSVMWSACQLSELLLYLDQNYYCICSYHFLWVGTTKVLEIVTTLLFFQNYLLKLLGQPVH